MIKRKILFSMFVVVFSLFLVACGADKETSDDTEKSSDTDKIQIVTTFTILTDIVQEVGGDKVEVYNLVPIGTDPHDYDPLPDDIKAATDADALFYYGFNLEGGDTGWFAKMVESVEQKWDNVFELSEGVEPLYLDEANEEVNPHGFLDPLVGVQMVENTLAALSTIDPENAAYYEENAANYLDVLHEIDEEYKTKINEIKEENRILITSERAYQYVAKHYGLKEGYIWAVDTEDTGTPEQIKELIAFIEREDPPALFLETNVDPRPMETVSAETGVEIYGKIFSDEIGQPGEDGDSYVNFLRYNIEVIHAGLTSKD